MSRSRLLDKAALITGAGAGIGAATAHLFCAEGAAVTLVDLNADSLSRTRASIVRQTPDAQLQSFVADVADSDKAREAVARTLAAFGRVDVLVNNAAMRIESAIGESDAPHWHRIVDTNLVGTANYCRAALPALRASGRGSIVNVSSCYAVMGRKGMGLYDATKAGLLAMTRALAFEEAPYGVRANAICPGSTLTEFHMDKAVRNGKSVEALKTERSHNSLLGRWATPEEIAFPILWFASEEASFITGTTLMVDGGLHVM